MVVEYYESDWIKKPDSVAVFKYFQVPRRHEYGGKVVDGYDGTISATPAEQAAAVYEIKKRLLFKSLRDIMFEHEGLRDIDFVKAEEMKND